MRLLKRESHAWPRIEDFQIRGHSCLNKVQHCRCHLYTRMRHSKQTATLLLTKRHANFDTSTRSAKGHAVYKLRMRNCSPWHTACSGSPHNALHSSSSSLKHCNAVNTRNDFIRKYIERVTSRKRLGSRCDG